MSHLGRGEERRFFYSILLLLNITVERHLLFYLAIYTKIKHKLTENSDSVVREALKITFLRAHPLILKQVFILLILSYIEAILLA